MNQGFETSAEATPGSDDFRPEVISLNEELKQRKERAIEICKRVREMLGTEISSAIGLTSVAALKAYANTEHHDITFKPSESKF